MNEVNGTGLTKKQRRELRKQEKQADIYRTRRRGRVRSVFIMSVIALAVLGTVYFYVRPDSAPDTTDYVNSDTDPFRGPDNAPVIIEEYSDYQCPACQNAETVLPQLLDAYPTQVRLIFNDYPLSIHSNSRPAAEAAQCAYAQGKFWDYHDRLFSDQKTWSGQSNTEFSATLKKYAADLSLDQTKFDLCLDNGEQASAVSHDINEGNQRKINSTPTFIVNGVEYIGGKSLEEWRAVIDEAIAKAEAAKAAAPINGNTNVSSDSTTNTNG